MKIDVKDKLESISMTALWEGNSKAAGMMAAIRKLLGHWGA
jgi:hypothetical protein